MKLLPIILPFLGPVLGDQTGNEAGIDIGSEAGIETGSETGNEKNSIDKEKMAEQMADKIEHIPKEKSSFKDPKGSNSKLGHIHWENVYFEDTLDILGSKKAKFQKNGHSI